MKNVLYLSTNTTEIQERVFQNITKFEAERLHFTIVETMCDVINKLNDESFKVDVIVFDVTDLQEDDNSNITRLVDSINFMIKNTKYNASKRTTRIMIAVSLHTDINVVKEAVSIGVSFFPRGDHFTTDDRCIAIHETTRGKIHVPKKIHALLRYKKDVAVDDAYLTNRQQQILRMIQDTGASNKVIARILNITESAVKMHIGKILKKTGLKNRTQLALIDKE